ncbi:MAG: right-handed parallel beta-helix repeat-containing protein [Bacteroidota bacterium]|nr:right-handed parallel beta-helix repeat-containing protein [Bacteroidota bacterium]
MKQFTIAAIIIFAVSIFMNSCKNNDTPEVTVTPSSETGWYGDEITFSILASSDEEMTIAVSNSYDTDVFDKSVSAGESTTDYTYTMPNDITDGEEIIFTFVVTNTTADLSATKEVTITASPGGTGNTITHEGTLEQDETWNAGDNHIVDGTLYLEGNVITIEPGTVIKFLDGAQINLGYNSNASTALIAEGTEEAPITFTSANATPVAGDWDGIFIYEGTAPTTTFQYCIFEYGGGYANYSAMIYAQGNVTFAMDYCTVRHSASQGILLEDDETSFSSFTHNTVSNITGYALSVQANGADGIGTGNSITVSGNKGILVESSTLDKSSVSWKAQTAPFVIEGTVNIQSTAGTELTINPGATVCFLDGAEFDIAYSSDKYGTLIADGTSENPILFTSANGTPVAGDWDGIFMYNGTTSSTSFEYCTIEYGGGYANFSAMISAEGNASFSMDNCTLRYSAAYGINLDDDATAFTSFTNNTMSDIANQFIKLQANAADGIGTGNDFQASASNKGIMIESSTMDKANSTWLPQNAPYVIDGTVHIQSTSSSVLTIQAGTTVSFSTGAEIDIAYSSGNYGKIIAEGTVGNEITFTSAAPEGSMNNGDWDGIFLYNGTMSGTVFDHCIFQYGGGYANFSAEIYLDDTGSAVTISNCTIEHSESNGISYDGIDDNPTLIDLTFNNIDGENINIR